jgi:hypothetical protein
VVIGSPQSSTTFTLMVCGQPPGAAPPDPNSENTGNNWLGVHAFEAPRVASSPVLDGGPVPAGATTESTLTVLGVPSENCSVIVPLWIEADASLLKSG